MAVNIPGLISIIVFYLLILLVGVFAARKTGFKARNLSRTDVMLAGRNMGMLVGIFTMTATWVGGGYINGSAEVIATKGWGLVWCQAPLGYSMSLVMAGIFFAEKMRNSGFQTMLDPFHHKYGRVMGCLLYLPAIAGDTFYSAAILTALGATLKVILDINLNLSVIISAVIALLYTLLGGLYSVAYTDVVQLFCIVVGLWLGLPFAMTSDASRSIADSTDWLGKLDIVYVGSFIDYYLLLMFGGIAVQVVWQRVLSARSVGVAKALTLMGAIGCVICATPAILIGAVASTADWNQTAYGHETLQAEDVSLTLPLVYFYMTPPAVAIVGLGAVSAAVMSSTDSALLSSSTMFACNVFAVIHKAIHGNEASDTMVVWVMRASQVVLAALACAMALSVSSIYYLFLLCTDIVYVVLFPQLACVLYIRWSNAYGSLAGYVLGLLLRLLGGEPGLNLPPVIEYPWMEPGGIQHFPFRTLSMLVSIFSILVFSLLARLLFLRHILPLSWDVFRCFQYDKKDEAIPAKKGLVNTAYVPEKGQKDEVQCTKL